MKKEKSPWEDDGRTLANMELPGTPWQAPPKEEKRSAPLDLTAKERRALMKAAVLLACKLGFLVLGAFFLLLLFLRFTWLR